MGKKRSHRFLFYAFDIIYLDGFDLRACPFIERRKVLETPFKKTKPPLMISETIESVGSHLKNACKLELEGIVSKNKQGPYRSGRSANWTKVTCRKRETFIVVGIAYKATKSDGIYLGRPRKENTDICRQGRARLQRSPTKRTHDPRRDAYLRNATTDKKNQKTKSAIAQAKAARRC